MSKNIIITGGAGFIGSHVVRLFVNRYPHYNIINVDALTYAGNLQNLKDIESLDNYFFEHVDITEVDHLATIFRKHSVTDVIHLAAESHVDRSIEDPLAFVKTNVLGTVNLLQTAKTFWTEDDLTKHRFYQVSTDEVYGTLSNEGFFYETSSYDPHSPYAASKASADHFVRAFADTYNMNVVVSNCSNNYGSHHFPEKLIPLTIHNIKNNIPIPIYGKGENVRDWLWVEDHARAIDIIFHNASPNETYNVGGCNEWKNIELVTLICDIMDVKLASPSGTSRNLIKFVTDRAGHDFRYAINADKLINELGWRPSVTFEEGIEKTIDWYLSNEEWLNNVVNGNYQEYYNKHYK